MYKFKLFDLTLKEMMMHQLDAVTVEVSSYGDYPPKELVDKVNELQQSKLAIEVDTGATYWIEYKGTSEKVNNIEMSTRLRNCLYQLDVEYTTDLLNISPSDLRRIRFMGPVTRKELEEKILIPYGIKLKNT